MMAQFQAVAKRTHSPGLRLSPGHALSCPLGVRGQVVNQLATYLVSRLKRVSLLQHTKGANEGQKSKPQIYKQTVPHA